MENYFRFVAALILVIALIGAAAWVVRRFGLAGRIPSIRGRAERRLSVVEFIALDPKTRMVLVQRDDIQHLLLLGQAGPVVVERGIKAPPEPNSKSEDSPETIAVEAAE